MTHPALVIFDMAGTTVEDRGQVPAAFTSALEAHGMVVSSDDIRRMRGASKRQAIRSLLPRDEADRAERVYADFRAELARRYSGSGVRAVGGGELVFKDLRARGIKVGLTTGFDRDIANLLLSALGWTRTTIDTLVCGDDVDNGRPAPDLILLTMKLNGIADPQEVANVGDTVLDLESGARAGVLWNIGVLSGAHARETLAKAPHTHIVPSVADLPF